MVFSTTPITGKEARRMRYSNQGRFRQQVRFLRRQFLQDGNLPFTNVLSDQIVSQALTAAGAYWVDRIYSPLVTLWVFLGQVLSADHSCRAAVARLIAHRLSRGQRPCSAETGAYCQARKRLPAKFFSSPPQWPSSCLVSLRPSSSTAQHGRMTEGWPKLRLK